MGGSPRQGKAEYAFCLLRDFTSSVRILRIRQSNKKTARRRFRSQIYGWASRIRTYITGTKNQGPAIGRWPSVCHKAFCDYNVSGMVKPNKQPIRQNATTIRTPSCHRRRSAIYRALSSQNATALAAATLSESTPCAIGIFTV